MTSWGSCIQEVKNDGDEGEMEEGRFILVQERTWICELTCGGGKEEGRLSRFVRTKGKDQKMLLGTAGRILGWT